MARISLALLAAALLLTGCSRQLTPKAVPAPQTSGPEPPAPVVELELQQAGIVFAAPKGWAFSQEPPEEAAALMQPVSSVGDLPAVIVQLKEVPEDMTLELAVSSYARFLGPDVEDKEIVVDEAFRLPVHDIPAYEIRYHGKVQNTKITCSHVLFFARRNVLVLTRMAEREKFDELLPAFNQILEEMAFSKP